MLGENIISHEIFSGLYQNKSTFTNFFNIHILIKKQNYEKFFTPIYS